MSYDEWLTRGHDAGFCKKGGCKDCEICHDGHWEQGGMDEEKVKAKFPKCDLCQEGK